MASYLLDTNIVLRFTDTNSSQYDLVINAISKILLDTSQVIVEFWVVATRPIAVNGLGWTVAETEQAVKMLINQFKLLEETLNISLLWLNLVTTHNISGKHTHDLRIQAVMLAHNISDILTLNPKDFVEVEGIYIIHPSSLSRNS